MPVVPLGVVTLTVLVPAVNVQVVLTVVAVDPMTVQVFPVPDTVTAVAPARFVPLSVNRTPVPCVTGFGVIEASVGAEELTTVSVKLWIALEPTPFVAVKVIL